MDTPRKPPSDLPIVLSIHLGDEGVSIYCDPIPLIEQHGADPAIWASALAASLQTASRAHAACLVEEESGEHPSVEAIYERILEALPDAMDSYSNEDPDNFSAPAPGEGDPG